MLSLIIEDKNIENIFLKEFNSNKQDFFNFIKSSFNKLKYDETKENENINLMNLQMSSMLVTWDNNKDKAWDEL